MSPPGDAQVMLKGCCCPRSIILQQARQGLAVQTVLLCQLQCGFQSTASG